MGARFDVRVWGPYACFTRPEFKAERVTYPCITPSAARGVLEAIFWKPEVRWEVRDLLLLRPIRHAALLRNEVDGRQGGAPIVVERHRLQRSSLILRDVAYVIHAELELRPHATEPLAKYRDQVGRSLERGRCFQRPYLGTRECAADFAAADGDETPIDLDLDIGTMLFDLAFRTDPGRVEMDFRRHGAGGPVRASGYAEPLFFHAWVRRGTLAVPPDLYRTLDRLEGRDAAGAG